MSNSLRLLVECHQRGLLSKEAAEQVNKTRQRLIRRALRKHAAAFFQSLVDAPVIKEAGIGEFLFRRKVVPPAPMGLFDKLRAGGLTGGQPGKGTANLSDVAANLAKMMAAAGLVAGTTHGIGALMSHSREKKVQEAIASSYQRMFDEVPELRETEEEHPGTVNRSFGILAKFAPSLAAEPSIAGAWVENAARMGQISPDTIRGLAETQSKIDEAASGRHKISPAVSPLRADAIVTRALMP
jgi:hypothetical protein